VERIVVYKFPQKSREEIEAMFELSDLKQTRVYQEALAKEEARGEVINLIFLVVVLQVSYFYFWRKSTILPFDLS